MLGRGHFASHEDAQVMGREVCGSVFRSGWPRPSPVVSRCKVLRKDRRHTKDPTNKMCGVGWTFFSDDDPGLKSTEGRTKEFRPSATSATPLCMGAFVHNTMGRIVRGWCDVTTNATTDATKYATRFDTTNFVP